MAAHFSLSFSPSVSYQFLKEYYYRVSVCPFFSIDFLRKLPEAIENLIIFSSTEEDFVRTNLVAMAIDVASRSGTTV